MHEDVLWKNDRPYLKRIYLQKYPQIRLHCFYQDDPDPDFHDHPWDFVSHILSGSYRELSPEGEKIYEEGSIIVHKAEDLHRIELVRRPVWTLFMPQRPKRLWGFMTKDGWVTYKQYLGV